jgi:hypothetical protein
VPAIERGLPGLIACQRHVECSLIVSVRGYRIRLTDQLVRPALRHLRQRGDAAELTRRKALATSPGFSMLLDVRRPRRRPRSRSCALGFVWHPVDLTESDRAGPRGQPSMRPATTSCSSVLGAPCGSPWGGRRDATPAAPIEPDSALVSAIPEAARPARACFVGRRYVC